MSLQPFAPASPATGLAYQQLGGAHSQRLQGWFAALAGRTVSAPATIAILGDSGVAGNGATTFARTYFQALATTMRSRLGLPAGGRGFLNPQPASVGPWSPSSYVTITGGTMTGYNGFGPANITFDLSATSATLAFALNGDSADIVWARTTGAGTFSWKVDAGSATNVSTAGATQDGMITHVSLGTAGAHTLTISYVSGSPVYLDGVVEYNGDYSSGLHVHGCGTYGATTGSLLPPTEVSQAQAMAALNPSLIIFELGLNDAQNGIAVTSYQANLAALVALHRAQYSTPPPFLFMPGYCNGGTTPAVWQNYVNAAYQVAAADSLGQVDMLDLTYYRMPATSAANTWGLFYSDNRHPSDKGHQLIADVMTDFLLVA